MPEMTNCPKCGNAVARLSKSCPVCQTDVNAIKNKQMLYTMAGVAVLVILIAIFS